MLIISMLNVKYIFVLRFSVVLAVYLFAFVACVTRFSVYLCVLEVENRHFCQRKTI